MRTRTSLLILSILAAIGLEAAPAVQAQPLTTFHDTELGLAYRYNSIWMRGDVGGDIDRHQIAWPVRDVGAAAICTLMGYKDGPGANLTPTEFQKHIPEFVNVLSKWWSKNNFKVVDSGKLELGGYPAIQVTYDLRVEIDGKPVAIRYWTVFAPRRGYLAALECNSAVPGRFPKSDLLRSVLKETASVLHSLTFDH